MMLVLSLIPLLLPGLHHLVNNNFIEVVRVFIEKNKPIPLLTLILQFLKPFIEILMAKFWKYLHFYTIQLL